MSDQQRDNDTLPEKIRWRREALRLLGDVEPVVCETYGGFGTIGRALYAGVRQGMVLEKESAKALMLARLRPSWSVYEGDTVRMLRLGAGGHLPFNYLDVDPHGSPWSAIEAFFALPDRLLADRLVLVVHDGLHRVAKMGRAWSVEDLELAVLRFGNTYLKESYGAASQWMLQTHISGQRWRMDQWRWAAGGDRQKNAHWLAVLTR